MGLFYKQSFHIFIQQKIKHRRHYHSLLLLHSKYTYNYIHISHYNWNKVLRTMSSPSSGLLTLGITRMTPFVLSVFLLACLLIQRYVSVCMFQNVISQNMFTIGQCSCTHRNQGTQIHYSTLALLCCKDFFLLLFTLTGLCFFP